jgi:hypothetical protein
MRNQKVQQRSRISYHLLQHQGEKGRDHTIATWGG